MKNIRLLIRESIKEALNFEFEQKGGMIVFSADINATIEGHKFVSKIRAMMDTIRNKFLLRKKVTQAVKQSLPPTESFGFTIGKGYKGRFYDSDTGLTFDEDSYTLEVIGVSTEYLQLIARNISRIFNQKMVLVKDYQTGKIYMEDPN